MTGWRTNNKDFGSRISSNSENFWIAAIFLSAVFSCPNASHRLSHGQEQQQLLQQHSQQQQTSFNLVELIAQQQQQQALLYGGGGQRLAML
uniref:Uncharacterized protein n=1 Tax=Ditylenchus dipsaci TaxID=166011 RepID=A0A915E4D8_9BILA